MLFKSKKVIGLDIGTSSIKVVELDVSRNSATLQRFSMVETPVNGMALGDIIETPPLAEAVSYICQQAGVKSKNVSTGLWGSSVIVKKISIPKMEKSLVREQIRWEAEQYIPYELSEVNLDYFFLDSGNEAADSMDILLVAAKRDQIMKYMEILEMSGLQLKILDVNGFALANIFEFNNGPAAGTVGILNIGSIFTNLVVLNGSDVVYCRDVSVGGSLYTSEIQKAMGVSFEEAESLKLNSSRDNSSPEQLTQVIQQTHEAYCDEIQASIDFFHNTTPGMNVSKLYLTGGACRTPGIMKAISDVTQLECEHFDPLERVKVNKSLGDDFKSHYRDFVSIVLGLGLRKVGD